jgi:predicted HTH domain antitoxin
MFYSMILELSDAILEGTDMTPELARTEVAVALYRDRKVSMGRAALLAGITRPEFQTELGRRGVTVNYDVSDFEEDLVAIEKLVSR